MAVSTRDWDAYHGGFDSDGGAFSLAGRRGLAAEEALSLAIERRLRSSEALNLDLPGGLKAKEMPSRGGGALPLASRDGLAAEDGGALSLTSMGRLPSEEEAFSLPSGPKTEEVSSGAIRSWQTTEELLLEQLLSSFDRREDDPQLEQWMQRKGPGCPFFLFMIKASAEKAQVLWCKKKCSRFSPERRGYTGALRVARLGADGVHLEQAGEGGQPGALCYHIDIGYMKLRPPKGVVCYEGVPLREVALIRRLPGGDGISITSRIDGLGVQLGDIVFLFPCCTATVALTFTDQGFYVSTKFTEEPLYAKVGLDFINITAPVENLIKELYSMYKQEEQDKKNMLKQQNQDDHEDREELMRRQKEQESERKEQERKKREELQKRRADTKKYKSLRKEMKEMVRQMEGTRTDEEKEQHEACEGEACYPRLILPPL
ncbi:hypothetical protein ACP70R_009996 [Stipagrostis hirtigluma subsp. patula]